MNLSKLIMLVFFVSMPTAYAAPECGSTTECLNKVMQELDRAKKEIAHLRVELTQAESKLDKYVSDDGKWLGDDSGLVGPRGPRGPRGATGPRGPKGSTGAQGAKGPAGASVAIRWYDPGLNFNLNTHWGNAHRKAEGYCQSKGYRFGVPNGHGSGSNRGVYCIK